MHEATCGEPARVSRREWLPRCPGRAGGAAGPRRHERGVGGGGPRRRSPRRGQGRARRPRAASRPRRGRPPCRPRGRERARGRRSRPASQLADGRVAARDAAPARGRARRASCGHRGHLSPGEVVTVLAPVASALGRLHDLGVVHGDVSPGNVLLDLDGRAGARRPRARPRRRGRLARGLGHRRLRRARGAARRRPHPGIRRLRASGPLGLALPVGHGAGAAGPAARARAGVPGRRGVRAGRRRAVAAAVSAEPGDRPGAHELAWLLFGAAEPEPLRLVRGDDEVSAVTYRLRAAARPRRPSLGLAGAVGRCFAGLLPGRARNRPQIGAERVPRRRGRHARPGRSESPVGRDGGGWRVVAGPHRGPVLTAVVLLAVLASASPRCVRTEVGRTPDTVRQRWPPPSRHLPYPRGPPESPGPRPALPGYEPSLEPLLEPTLAPTPRRRASVLASCSPPWPTPGRPRGGRARRPSCTLPTRRGPRHGSVTSRRWPTSRERACATPVSATRSPTARPSRPRRRGR